MNKTKISLFGSAIRTDRWISLYKNICENNIIEIEIVLCGNVEPKFDLPSNFKFIYSDVKPSQCAQIALNNTASEIVSLIGDDCVFSDNFFDNLYEAHSKNNNYIFGGAFKRNNEFYKEENYLLDREIQNSPFFPFSPLLNKSEIETLGGIDKNFIAVMWHEDLIMRIISKYDKKCKILNNSFCFEETIGDFNLFKRIYFNYIKGSFQKKFLKPGPNLFVKYGSNIDLPYLKSCWIGKIDDLIDKKFFGKNDKYFISKERLKSFEKFDSLNLEIETQGNKGHWQ